MTVSLVVYRIDDPLYWICQIYDLFESITVYNEGSTSVNHLCEEKYCIYHNILQFKNKECAFLTHLTQNFDQLSGVTVFVSDFALINSPDLIGALQCWQEFIDYQCLDLVMNGIPLKNSHTFSNGSRMHQRYINVPRADMAKSSSVCRALHVRTPLGLIPFTYNCFAIKNRCIQNMGKSFFQKIICMLAADENAFRIVRVLWQYLYSTIK